MNQSQRTGLVFKEIADTSYFTVLQSGEAETVNYESTIALFEKIEARNPAATHIHVFLDNARYHHARAVKQWMEETKVG